MSWIKITSRKQPWFHKVSLDVYDGGLYIISDHLIYNLTEKIVFAIGQPISVRLGTINKMKR